MTTIRHLIAELFNYDFAKCKSPAEFERRFYGKNLTITDLQKVHELLRAAKCDIGGKSIPSAMRFGPHGKKPPVAILAQLHGNEPAGLAGILLAMALSEAKMLNSEVIGIIGNPLASEQYFSAYMQAPRARQELRDAYRCGLGENEELLPDMNRIPNDFMTRPADNHHTRRAQELFHVGNHIAGILDIHSARGNMLCITDHKHNNELRNSPIRSVLVGLAEAIGAHSSSSAVAVKTFKTILSSLPNIEYQVGIEAGRHEAEDSPFNAAIFTQAFLHTIGASKLPAESKKESGQFDCYHVHPKWTYADLKTEGKLLPEDKVYMAAACLSADSIPKRADRVIVKKKDGNFHIQTIMQYIVQPAGDIAYATYQYDEMETIKEGTVVAVAIPSGTVFKAPKTAAGIFFSKSAALYDKDPAVGPWPVQASALDKIKFCYPCTVRSEILKM